jgi:hypothetical protein
MVDVHCLGYTFKGFSEHVKASNLISLLSKFSSEWMSPIFGFLDIKQL